MMGTRIAMIFTIAFCLLLTLACNPNAAPATDEPDLGPVIKSETIKFQELLDTLTECEAAIEYPHTISVSDIFPDDWLYEKLETTSTVTIEMCVIAVPIPEDIQEGFYEVKFEEQKELITLSSDRLTPPTNLYIVSMFKSNPHTNLMGVPADFRSFPKKIEHDYLIRHIVVESPYYVPHNGTHGIYITQGMRQFQDNGTNYDLANIIKKIREVNPYLENHAAEVYDSEEMWQLITQLRAQIDIIREDIDNALSYINDTGIYLYRPDELASSEGVIAFKAFMKEVDSSLVELEACIVEIEVWDFSNLEQHRSPATDQDQQ